MIDIETSYHESPVSNHDLPFAISSAPHPCIPHSPFTANTILPDSLFHYFWEDKELACGNNTADGSIQRRTRRAGKAGNQVSPAPQPHPRRRHPFHPRKRRSSKLSPTIRTLEHKNCDTFPTVSCHENDSNSTQQYSSTAAHSSYGDEAPRVSDAGKGLRPPSSVLKNEDD
ncbi:hypothetical protein E2C01_007178 [Portunus trituberculatus]|uniref:Uncharacterized protein n=1 Tax=Portunus trituberculatus TaxID=210409 RepID=A0A5B7CXG1_PORTR|nr:hypothetical protein [Portunus trituberculatus]